MNTKISKIMSVLAAATMVAASFVWAMPISAAAPGDGEWSSQIIPTTTKNVLVAGSGVPAMAVGSDGKTVYAIDTVAASFVMKSSDGGSSFDNVLNNYVTGAAGGVPVAIAVAPDDVNTVAVTDGLKVIISKDGGTTWSALPSPTLLAGSIITGISIAPARSGTLLGREYAISIADVPARIGVAVQATVATGSGVGVWGAGVGIYTMTYTNQAGVAGHVATVTIPAGTAVAAVVPIALTVVGDTGILDVTAVTPAVGNLAAATDTFTIGSAVAPPVLFSSVTNGATATFAVTDGAAVAVIPASSVAGGDVLIIGNIASWASVGPVGAGAITGTADFTSVTFTPNFLGDRTVVAVGTGVVGGSTTVYMVNTATNTIIQTAPVNIIVGSNTVDVGAPAFGIISSDIALPSNFDPTTSSGRRGYVGIASASVVDNDVYRFDDNSVRALSAVGGGSKLKSVAYAGTIDTGTLFVGQVGSTDVKYTTGMTSSTPTWTTTLKGPLNTSGAPNVFLRAASDFATSNKVYAGTVGANAAFDVSTDAGVSFNDRALINLATIASIRNMAFTPDAQTVFMSSVVGGVISLWKSPVPTSDTTWSRIFAKASAGNGSLLTNPAWTTTPAIFFAEGAVLNGNIYVSQDGGTSWATRQGPTGVTLGTWAVRDAQTIYFVDNGATPNMYKSTNAAFFWATGVPTNSNLAKQVSLPKANQVIIAGTGAVSMSTDDGATFTALSTTGLTGGDAYFIAADTNYATNNIIYVGSNGPTAPGKVLRVATDTLTNTWSDISSGNVVPVVSMTTRSGVLYVQTNSSANGLLRTLYPTDIVGNQNWTALNNSLPVATWSRIRTTTGINLYVTDSTTNFFAFNDFLATTKPTITSPDDNYNDSVNPNTGNGYQVDLKWKPMGSGTSLVNFADIEIVDKANGFTGFPTVTVAVAGTNPVYTTAFVFQPNKVYQWRVRAQKVASGQVIDSPWSDARTINVQSGSVVSQQYAGPVLLGPQGGAQNLDPNLVGFAWAPVAGATEYTVIVATDASLTKPVSGTPAKVTAPAYSATGLAYGTTYFWAVQATKPTTSVQTIGTFTTMQKPVTQPTTGTGNGTGTGVQPTIVVQTGEQTTPAYIWAVIAIGAILVIAVIILIVRTRRVP